MLNFGASKSRVRGGPGPRAPPGSAPANVSFSSCKFINDSIIRDYDFNFMTIRDSHVSIIDTSFIKRAGTINIEGLSEIFIKGSHFLQIENSPSLILFSDREASPESSLHMSHCRFESNVLTNYTGYSGLIDVGVGSAVIQDTVFYHNHVNMPVRGESIEFTNCVFNSNFASERGVFWGERWNIAVFQLFIQ